MANVLSAIGGVTAGLGLMYFLDPDQGWRRRALAKDQMVHAVYKTGDAMDATSRDIANRARGAVAELRGRLRSEAVNDDILRDRVRARVGAGSRRARPPKRFCETRSWPGRPGRRRSRGATRTAADRRHRVGSRIPGRARRAT